jgi:hypothetical protein
MAQVGDGAGPGATMAAVSIAVGHGDATLLQWKAAEGDPFVVLPLIKPLPSDNYFGSRYGS